MKAPLSVQGPLGCPYKNPTEALPLTPASIEVTRLRFARRLIVNAPRHPILVVEAKMLRPHGCQSLMAAGKILSKELGP
jgi:hypothetical protein